MPIGPGIGFIENLLAGWVSAIFAPTSMPGLAIALLAVIWMGVSWHRRQRAAKKPGMASWYFIIPCFVIAALALAAGSYGLGLQGKSEAKDDPPTAIRTPQQEKPKIEYVSAQDIGGSFSANPSPQPAIQFQATFATNVNWLKVYVDILESGPSHYRRLKITELKDYARGQQIVIPIVVREDDPNKNWIFRWGESDERFRANGGFSFFARVVLIGESGDEQYCYFTVVPNQINGRPYIMVLNEQQMNFRKEWEQLDARRN